VTIQQTPQRLDAAALARLADARDDVGMLTVIAGRGEESAEEIRTVLVRHRRDFALGDLPETAAALCDSRGPGPAHALVAALSTGEAEVFMLPAPAATRVLIAPRVDLEPLARALDEARRVGVVDVRRDGVRVVECGAGGEEVEDLEFELEGDWTELRGSTRANPLRAYESMSQRDRYEHRIDAQRARELAQADRELRALARRRGWAATLVAGDPELAEIVAGELPGALRVGRRLAAWESAGALAHELRDELAGARRDVVLAIVAEAEARPHGFATGAHGVASAIADGRAREVIVDPATLGDATDDVLRPALAASLPVRFADGVLAGRHGALCALTGAAAT
jgi:hypothetical protein